MTPLSRPEVCTVAISQSLEAFSPESCNDRLARVCHLTLRVCGAQRTVAGEHLKSFAKIRTCLAYVFCTFAAPSLFPTQRIPVLLLGLFWVCLRIRGAPKLLGNLWVSRLIKATKKGTLPQKPTATAQRRFWRRSSGASKSLWGRPAEPGSQRLGQGGDVELATGVLPFSGRNISNLSGSYFA